MLLDEGGSPTFAPTTALADGAALTAVIDAIGSLSAAQLGEAVAGEVHSFVAMAQTDHLLKHTNNIRYDMSTKCLCGVSLNDSPQR